MPCWFARRSTESQFTGFSRRFLTRRRSLLDGLAELAASKRFHSGGSGAIGAEGFTDVFCCEPSHLSRAT